MRHLLIVSMFAASVLAPQAVFSEEKPDASPDAELTEPLFGPLTFDVLLALGLSSELYLHGEPSLDIGVVKLGKTGAIGIGGGIDIGWCALCGIVSVLSDVSWSGSFYAPFARSTVHAGTLGGLLPQKQDGNSVDLFVGALVGPSFYKFEAGFDDSSSAVTHRRVTLRFAPLLGLRLGLGGNRFLLFGEYRYNIEGGFSAVTYTNEDGSEEIVQPDTVNRRGNEFIIGIGVRI